MTHMTHIPLRTVKVDLEEHPRHVRRTPAPAREHVGGNASCASCVMDLEALAHRVVRLSPDRHDPERFHLEKDEVAAELRRLCRLFRIEPRGGR